MDAMIGRYKIINVIGKGGMGTVYQALDTAIERLVALKLLPSQLSGEELFVKRFRREAQVIARLEHPHIVPIYDIGQHGEQPYIVMRLLSGGTLFDHQARFRSDYDSFLRVLDNIADALDSAHSKQIVHRDIKPSNILFDKKDTVYLLDFGIAKVLGAATQLTRTGLIGSPAYMSPEQFASDTVDGRSDQYSLAVTVYEILSGQLPFEGTTAQMMFKHISAEPLALHQADPALSPSITPVLNKALAKSPEDRYASVHDFINALRIAMQSAVAPIPQTLVEPYAAAGVGAAGHNVAATVATPVAQKDEAKRKKKFLVPIFLIGLLGLFLLLFMLQIPQKLINGTADGDDVKLAVLIDSLTMTASVPQPTDTPLPTDMPTATPNPTDVPTEAPSPTDTPQATATLKPTQTPTNTPRPTRTQTPTPTPTETPEPTATKAANSTGAATSGNGMPVGFESFGSWTRGNEANGTFTSSAEQSKSGGHSAKLEYNFETEDNDYVVFMQLNDISGTPNALKVWVYGDGSGHFLNGWILDAKGQTWQVPFGQIFHTGWSQMTGVIDTDQKWPWTHISGPKDNKVDYPIQFRGFVLDDYTSSYQGSGEIFIDDLTVATVSNPTAPGGPVAITPTVGSAETTTTPSATEEVVTATDVGRILYTSGSTLMTTDPAWSSPQEVGTAASNSCGSPASTVSGQDISLSYGYYCPIGGSITKCASPNGAYEILVDGRDTENILLAIYPAGNQDAGVPIYTGSLDQAEGLRWSPNSDSYLFVIGNTVARGDLSAHYQQIIPTAYNPIFSADGSLILYRKPIGPGVNDVFVSNADGSNQHNVTNVSAIDKSCAAWVR